MEIREYAKNMWKLFELSVNWQKNHNFDKGENGVTAVEKSVESVNNFLHKPVILVLW